MLCRIAGYTTALGKTNTIGTPQRWRLPLLRPLQLPLQLLLLQICPSWVRLNQLLQLSQLMGYLLLDRQTIQWGTNKHRYKQTAWLATWNINGLRAKWHEASEFVITQDIVTFTETKLDNKATTRSLTVTGYTHKTRNAMEVVLLHTYVVRTRLQSYPLFDIQDSYVQAGLEVMIVEVWQRRPPSVIIIGVYCPPQSRPQWFDTFNDFTLQLLNRGKLIIMGDLTLTWTSSTQWLNRQRLF